MTKKDDEEFKNGGIITLSAIIKHAMASASEAELAALFYGCKQAVPLCWKWKLCSGESCGSSAVSAGRVNMLLYI